ncbi:adenosine kinase [Sedimentisphaera salicampi]|uniref:Putative sugar kinase YdjH n=1 Tax=Sedimentisphaera salicampi TaxID=1941349 RepID=A0A1W6LQ03_9BACT|nr:adenosine kinase [Sedimentisphaera salicampi]ARN57803.1 putative sugar kinase YdjH [Sedimentisphaera salicampi]OXU13971.1 putative sugar kinase YdjH [Sedimentisphaera salicampi]
MARLEEKKIIGVGSPVMDLLAQVDDEFVSTHAGSKGGMELVEDMQIQTIVQNLKSEPAIAAGGSAANTIFALAKLEVAAAFLGKVGRDETAKEYLDQFEKLKGDLSKFKYCDESATAKCLSLVTDDGERTMRTCLGAAANMAEGDIDVEDFRGFDHAHFEGYLLFNKEMAVAALKAAKKAGCSVSLDLGSFEVVKAAGDGLRDLLREYVDIVFANEDEAEAFTGDSNLETALSDLSELCDVAVVKLGAKGAMLRDETGKAVVEAGKAETVIDTTGAGDYWAAGFLYGYLNGLPIKECGELGSLIGAEVVQHLGADLPSERWQNVLEQFKSRVLVE